MPYKSADGKYQSGSRRQGQPSQRPFVLARQLHDAPFQVEIERTLIAGPRAGGNLRQPIGHDPGGVQFVQPEAFAGLGAAQPQSQYHRDQPQDPTPRRMVLGDGNAGQVWRGVVHAQEYSRPSDADVEPGGAATAIPERRPRVPRRWPRSARCPGGYVPRQTRLRAPGRTAG